MDKKHWCDTSLKKWQRSEAPKSRFLLWPDIPPWQVLYDPMHGLARLVTIIVMAILSKTQSLCRRAYRELVAKLKKCHWSETSGFNCKFAKAFFGDLHDQQLIAIIESSEEAQSYTFQRPSGARKSLAEAATSALKSARFYWQFIYSRGFEESSILDLEDARDDIEAFLWSLDHQMCPAPHYLLHHFIEDVRNLYPVVPFYWLNEANEAFHKFLRKMAILTPGKRQQCDIDTYNTYELLLRHARSLHICREKDPTL